MFCRLIGKISSFTRTATLRRFSQVEDNKQKENPISIDSNLKKFPVGIKTFNDLAQPSNIFVDKSLLIEKLLNTNNSAFLFTRPRGWGKTLNIDMLENFFQADVDKTTGIPDFEKQSQKYLFEKLNISKINLLENPITGKPTDELAIKFQGQFPVVKLTVKDMSITSEEDIIRGFEEMLRPVFKNHSYILNSSNKKFIYEECELMKAYIYGKPKINWIDIELSLDYLINALYEVYDREVVLLIDDYDRNLNSLLAENSPFYSDTLQHFKCLLDFIKNNEKLLFTVFTGASEIAKVDISTGLNHLYHDSVIDSGFSEYFGFTEGEVDSLLNTLIDLNPKLQKKEVKDLVTFWYDGYKIEKKTIYNPWSIMHCFNNLHKDDVNPYRQYWIDVSSTAIIENTVKVIPTIGYIEELMINRQTEFIDIASFTFEKKKLMREHYFRFYLIMDILQN